MKAPVTANARTTQPISRACRALGSHALTPLLIAALTLLSRLPVIGKSGLWYDEVYTANLTMFNRTLSGIIDYITRNDAHPPLHYFVTWAWTHALNLHAYPTLPEHAEALLRLPSALFGAVSAGLLYASARRLGTPLIATLAAAAYAVSPAAFHQDIEARMYAQLGCLTLACVYAAVRYHETPLKRWALLLGLSAGAAGMTQYLGLVLATGPFLYAASGGQWKRLTAAAALTTMICAPWLPELAFQYTTGKAYPDARLPFKTLVWPVVALVTGAPGPMTIPWVLWPDLKGKVPLVFPLLILPFNLWLVSRALHKQTSGRTTVPTTRPSVQAKAAQAGLILALPPLLLWVLGSLFVNTLDPRYVAPFMPGLLIAWAGGVSAVCELKLSVSPRLLTALPILAALPLAGSLVYNTAHTLAQPTSVLREAVKLIDAQAKPGSLVAFNTRGGGFVMSFYRLKTPSLPVARSSLGPLQRAPFVYVVREFAHDDRATVDDATGTLFDLAMNRHRQTLIASDSRTLTRVFLFTKEQK